LTDGDIPQGEARGRGGGGGGKGGGECKKTEAGKRVGEGKSVEGKLGKTGSKRWSKWRSERVRVMGRGNGGGGKGIAGGSEGRRGMGRRGKERG